MGPIILGLFVALVIFVGLWFLKLEHQTRKIKIVLTIIILVVLYLSIVNVFSSGTVDLSSPRGVLNGVYVYFGWIGKTVSNLWDIGSDTTGRVVQAVKMNNTKTDIKKK